MGNISFAFINYKQTDMFILIFILLNKMLNYSLFLHLVNPINSLNIIILIIKFKTKRKINLFIINFNKYIFFI